MCTFYKSLSKANVENQFIEQKFKNKSEQFRLIKTEKHKVNAHEH